MRVPTISPFRLRAVRALSLAAVMATAACGGDDAAPAPSSTIAVPSTLVGASPGPGTVDPRAVGGCSILTAEQMASVFGEALNLSSPRFGSSEVTDCQWSTTDGRAVGFEIDLLGADVARRIGTPVAVGSEAYLEREEDDARLVALVHGWPIVVTDLGVPSGDAALISVAQLLAGTLMARPADAATAPAATVDTSMAAPVDAPIGQIVALEFTTATPAALAGTMTLEALNAAPGGTSLSVCAVTPAAVAANGAYLIQYGYEAMAGGAGSPVPVRSASIIINGYSGPGSYQADMTVIYGTDLALEGVADVVVNADPTTGMFTLPDPNGGEALTGAWRCVTA